MKSTYLSVIGTIMVGFVLLSSQAFAQQKTLRKECREEWKANKTANQGNGITEKAYVAQCQAGAAARHPPATAPAARPVTAAPSAVTNGGGKTTKACQEEWKANKATNQANGVTEKAYVEKCRIGAVSAQPTAAPAEVRPLAPPATVGTTFGEEPRSENDQGLPGGNEKRLQ